MEQSFEYIDESSNQFWEYSREGTTISIKHGIIGTEGEIIKSSYDTVEGSQALQNINPNYTMLITMYAHAEDKEKGLVINRNKIPCFYVQVSIVEI